MKVRLYSNLCFLILALSFYSCCELKNYQKVALIDANVSPPLNNEYKNLVYKSEIDAFGNHLSGIVLFKPMSEDSSSRFVMLTQFGLNLLDISVYKDKYILNDCQDFLNRSVIIKAIERNYRLMSFIPTGKATHFINTEDHSSAIRIRKGISRYTINYTNIGITRIKYKKGLFTKMTMDVDYSDNSIPEVIIIKSSPLKQQTKFTLLSSENVDR